MKTLFRQAFEALNALPRGAYRTLLLRTILLRMLVLLVQSGYHFRVGVMDATPKPLGSHAQRFRAFHNQIAQVKVKAFLYGFYRLQILVGKRAQQVLPDHFAAIAKHMVGQKEIEVGLQVKQPKRMNRHEIGPQLHDGISDFSHTAYLGLL
jgi:hypothetical protein